MTAAVERGLDIDEFAPRLAFFFNGHNNVFQEVAKFRAARRMWATIMRERFGATNPKSQMLRFHTQTGGVTLTAQQPENNIVRVALQGFAAVCGGTQSLHTNGFDEALALPTERAAKIALRTQQIIGAESGATDTVDPFAGSFYVESLTDEIESRALELIAKVDALGGSTNAIEFITGEIDESAWGYQERYRIGQDVVIGVNEYVEDQLEVPDLLRVDPESEAEQVGRLTAFKADRDGALVEQRLEELRERRTRHRQPDPAHPRRAEGPLLDGRGLRRDAGRVREVPADRLSTLVSRHDLHSRHLLLRRRRRDPRDVHRDRVRRDLRLPGDPAVADEQAPRGDADDPRDAGPHRPLRDHAVRDARAADRASTSRQDRDLFSETWVTIPFVILIILLGLGGAFFNPREKQLAALARRDIDAGGVLSEEYHGRARSVGIVGALSSLLILFAIFCMVAKPFA